MFRDNYWVNIVVSVLCYVGAMGFIVLIDLTNKIKHKSYKITFTSKIIIVLTFLITLIGTLQLFFFENSISQYKTSERMMISVFQSISAMSTGGFNTVNLGEFGLASVLIISMLMFIGASPSGTGGGIKTTTLSAVLAFIYCKLGDKRDIMIGKHRLPSYRVDTALTNILFYGFLLCIGIFALSLTETFSLPQIVIEAASALGTVGLSTGITSEFSVLGKVILCLLMYIGRVGVLAFGTAMLLRMSKKEKNEVKASQNDDLAI